MIGTSITQAVSNNVFPTHFLAVTQLSGASQVATENFSIPQGPSKQLKSAPPGSSASDAVNVHKPTTQGNTEIFVCHFGC